MNTQNETPRHVTEFYEKCSKIVGKYEEERFFDSLGPEHYRMESPIEQVFYAALMTLARINGIPEAEPIELANGECIIVGLEVRQQYEIGNYRTDFYISKSARAETRSLIVECDSQEFHERSERERRYEKARDRFLISKGHKVFHFTGKEILKEPFRVASEVIAHIIPGYTIKELLESINDY